MSSEISIKLNIGHSAVCTYLIEMEKDNHIKITGETSGTGKYNIGLIGYSLPQGRFMYNNGGYLKYSLLKFADKTDVVKELIKLILVGLIGYLLGKKF